MNPWRRTRGWASAGQRSFLLSRDRLRNCKSVVQRAAAEGLPIRLLGGGSNLLVREVGVPGVVLRLSAPAFNQIQTAKNVATAGGGARLGHVISTAVRAGLGGLEALVGIPGTIGGALHGNAGGNGGDIGQWTCSG